MALISDDCSVKSARDHIATLALSIFQIHGLPAPGPDELGSIVFRAEAGMSAHQLRHPESIGSSLVGQIDQLVLSQADPKKRPTNIYSADAVHGSHGGEGSGRGSIKGGDPANLALRGNMPPRSSGSDSSDAGRSPGTSSRFGGDYQMLDLNSPQSLHQLTGIGWGTTAGSVPYARAGLNFGTVKDLRNYDKAFTGADVLKAASDVKQLGFNVNDKRAMRDHATIRHYDNDPDSTNDAEKKFKHGVDNDKDMQELLRQRGLCKDPIKQKVLDAQIAEHTKHHLDESGLQKRIDDPKNHPKAKAAIKDDVDHIVHHDKNYRLEHGNDAARKSSDNQLNRIQHPETPVGRGPQAANVHKAEAAPAASREQAKIAKADENKSGEKAKNDLVADLGLDTGPAKPSQTPAKPNKPPAPKVG